MKKLLSVLMAVLMLSAVSLVSANDVGNSIGVVIETEDFEPLVWLCDNRVVEDDAVEPGRISGDGETLVERINNYAFEGETIFWDVLVMDKNGIEKVADVYVTVGPTQGAGNPIEANCRLDRVLTDGETPLPSCNARILEEDLGATGISGDNVAAYYTCEFVVETPESMHGENWVTIEAVDLDGLLGNADENEFWFFNPVIALSIDGNLDFGVVRPGTSSYSETILVGNDAELGSGVLLDMFVSGTDFYDPSSSGAKCPTSNQLSLSAFRYYVVNGAWSSVGSGVADGGLYDPVTTRAVDAEGYLNIQYGDRFSDEMYNEAEVLQAAGVGGYYAANVLAPGAEMAITFRLNLPEPCNGDFSSGAIHFWGEAI